MTPFVISECGICPQPKRMGVSSTLPERFIAAGSGLASYLFTAVLDFIENSGEKVL
ncbi:MAG: hypothetical protein ACYC7E_20115 [Armatimonadota bacterium]